MIAASKSITKSSSKYMAFHIYVSNLSISVMCYHYIYNVRHIHTRHPQQQNFSKLQPNMFKQGS